MIRYEEPLFRPPGEAGSLIFQIARGCPHNGCRFCGMYKGVRYRVRAQEEVLAEIAFAGRKYPEARRVFLADGDVAALGFETLRPLLAAINAAFPRLARICSYANGSSLATFSDAELAVLRSLKWHTLYIGLETGSQHLLESVGKREVVSEMIGAVERIQSAGMRASVMVLAGLGGRRFSREHAESTARALNAMQPRLLSVLRFIPVLPFPPFDGFEPLSEREAVAELAELVECLELRHTVFRADHSSNPLPLEARFPADKARLLRELREVLCSGQLDEAGPGILPAEL